MESKKLIVTVQLTLVIFGFYSCTQNKSVEFVDMFGKNTFDLFANSDTNAKISFNVFLNEKEEITSTVLFSAYPKVFNKMMSVDVDLLVGGQTLQMKTREIKIKIQGKYIPESEKFIKNYSDLETHDSTTEAIVYYRKTFTEKEAIPDSIKVEFHSRTVWIDSTISFMIYKRERSQAPISFFQKEIKD